MKEMIIERVGDRDRVAEKKGEIQRQTEIYREPEMRFGEIGRKRKKGEYETECQIII